MPALYGLRSSMVRLVAWTAVTTSLTAARKPGSLVFMVALGRVPAWVVVVLIARDLAVNGLRSIASTQGLVIAASEGGKIKTALQLIAITMLLVYFRYPALGTSITVDYQRAGLWILYISMAMSLFSGAQYMRQFLAAALQKPRLPA